MTQILRQFRTTSFFVILSNKYPWMVALVSTLDSIGYPQYGNICNIKLDLKTLGTSLNYIDN